MATLSEFITFLTARYYVNFTKGKHCCVSVATIVTRSSTMVRHTHSSTLLLLTLLREAPQWYVIRTVLPCYFSHCYVKLHNGRSYAQFYLATSHIVTWSSTMVRHTHSSTLLLLTFNRNDVEMALDILISLPGFLQSRQAYSGTMAPNYI